MMPRRLLTWTFLLLAAPAAGQQAVDSAYAAKIRDRRDRARVVPGEAEADVRGTGYVVETLEAALWRFTTTDS